MTGVILGGANNVFDVECGDGLVRRCRIKGKILRGTQRWYNPLAPGDQVVLEERGEDVQIAGLGERKNAFVRWNVKGRSPQLLAANLDLILLVTTPDSPPFRPRFIDRALCQAEEAGIEPVILVNKCDLPCSPETAARIGDWERIGYRCVRVSARNGDGMPYLARLLEGKLSALAGQSGVGKSSVINVLDSGCVLKTGSLSQKYGRGSHTTVKGTLLRLTLNEALMGRMGARASVIDTPGVRRFVLDGEAGVDPQLFFREIRPFVGKCAFGLSCTHTTEGGCAVREAVAAGHISPERFESCLRIREGDPGD
ncbi:MAG: ribosome small subunit-dependent GTPase A [Spirochaetaceae bacterium]|jgi:ribosome biogenesis GTPase|nr:ribosome small subunit-dependent GTPase A [Spirochaetaceae bacterium]